METGNINGVLLRLWERYAYKYTASFGSLSFYEDFGNAMEKGLIASNGGIVLDAGCGEGGQWKRLMRTLRPKKIVGLDYSPTMRQGASKTKRRLQRQYRIYNWLKRSIFTRWLTQWVSEWRFYGSEVEIADGNLCEAIPYIDDTFDVVVMHLVGYYLPFDSFEKITSKEVLRVLKPGGYFITMDCVSQWNFKKEIAGFAFFKEFCTHFFGMIWTALVAKPVLFELQNLVNQGVLKYLSVDERKAVLETTGFERAEICARSKFLRGQFVTIRAFKPT